MTSPTQLSIASWKNDISNTQHQSNLPSPENKTLQHNFLRFTRIVYPSELLLSENYAFKSNAPSLILNNKTSAQQSNRSNLQAVHLNRNDTQNGIRHRKLASFPVFSNKHTKPAFTNIALVDMLKQKQRLASIVSCNSLFQRKPQINDSPNKFIPHTLHLKQNRSDQVNICDLNSQCENLVLMKHQRYEEFVKNMKLAKKEFQDLIQSKVQNSRNLKVLPSRTSPHNVSKKFFTIF